jgi:hypothetical protein
LHFASTTAFEVKFKTLIFQVWHNFTQNDFLPINLSSLGNIDQLSKRFNLALEYFSTRFSDGELDWLLIITFGEAANVLL